MHKKKKAKVILHFQRIYTKTNVQIFQMKKAPMTSSYLFLANRANNQCVMPKWQLIRSEYLSAFEMKLNKV